MKVPLGWKTGELGEHIDLLTGFPFESSKYSNASNDVKLLRGDNVVQASIRWDDAKRWPLHLCSELEDYCLKPGDIVLAMDRTWVKAGLKCAVIKKTDTPCLLVQRVARIRGRDDLDTRFAAHVLGSHRFVQYVKSVKTETAIPHISSQQIRDFTVLLPSIAEQWEIASILNCWDSGVEAIETLLAVNVERKRGLMQQLLTGQTRFKEFKGERWRTYRLGELLQEVDRYVTFDDEHTYKLASIRRRSEGLFFREALQGKDIKTKVMKTIRAGDFILSKMQVVHGAWGLVTREFDGMFVSDSYISLVPKDGSALKIEFLNYLSQMRLLRHMAYICSHGVHIEKMTFNLEDFLHEKITIPPTLDEQAKIVGVLAACDEEIKLLGKQLEALKEQKRGLMQKLLTGEIRVKAESKK